MNVWCTIIVTRLGIDGWTPDVEGCRDTAISPMTNQSLPPLGKAKIPSVVYAWWCQFWNFLTQFDHFMDLNAISCTYNDPLAVRKILHGAVAGRFIGMNQSRWILSFLYFMSLFYYYFFQLLLKIYNDSTATPWELSKLFIVEQFHGTHRYPFYIFNKKISFSIKLYFQSHGSWREEKLIVHKISTTWAGYEFIGNLNRHVLDMVLFIYVGR